MRVATLLERICLPGGKPLPTRSRRHDYRRQHQSINWAETGLGTSCAWSLTMQEALLTTAVCEPRVIPEINSMELTLPGGLLGFEGLKRWTLTGRSDEVPFLRLSSRDDLNITFVVMKPAGFIANYQPELHTVDVTVLELAGPHEACVLNIVTLAKTFSLKVNGPCHGEFERAPCHQPPHVPWQTGRVGQCRQLRRAVSITRTQLNVPAC